MATKIIGHTCRQARRLTGSLQARMQHTAPEQGEENYIESKYAPFRNDFSRKACDARRNWAQSKTGQSLEHIGQWMDDFDTAKLRGNIELPFGTIKIPVAGVGPLTINGEAAQGEFIAPFATTEGALTASVMRGVKAINEGSGAITRTGRQVVSRGPCFVTRNAAEAQMFGNWTKKQKERLQDQVVRKVSRHAMLEDIVTTYDFEAVHIVFLFNTGDACGQNIATVCSWNILQWLVKAVKDEIPQVQIKHAWIEANATSDKKPGALNVVHGRGMSTQAEVILPERVLNKYLNCTAEDYLSFNYYLKRMTCKTTPFGGTTINPGNTLTAIYLATGQDPACVSDSIIGNTFEVIPHRGEGEGVIVKTSFSNLLVGTVGGGTALPTQHEGLGLLGCVGEGKVRKFAEIVTAFTMALDISSSSASVAGIFASGHDKLGRNRPTGK